MNLLFKDPLLKLALQPPPVVCVQIELQLQILLFLKGGISLVINKLNSYLMNTINLLVSRLEVYNAPRQFSQNGSPKYGMIVLQENDSTLGVKIITLSLKQLNKLANNAFIKLTNEDGVNYHQWTILAQMVGNSRSYISVDYESFKKDDEWIDGMGVVNHRPNDGVSIFPQNFIFDQTLLAKLDECVVKAREETWKTTTFTRPPLTKSAQEDLPHTKEEEDLPAEPSTKKKNS